MSADVMFKATMVDGVYDKDPHKYPDAKKYDTLTFTKVLEDQLAVMDGTAATLCRDNKLPILVFDLADPDNIARAVRARTWARWSTRAKRTAADIHFIGRHSQP